jgi:hypothetical protein
LDSKLRFDLSRLVATGRRGEVQNNDMRDYLRVFKDVLIAVAGDAWGRLKLSIAARSGQLKLDIFSLVSPPTALRFFARAQRNEASALRVVRANRQEQ